ncbi:sugar transferase [Apilactobacillus bombintestini]|uniref:Sugar transferase n=1 Tax=Apilactobacillus bombintestini TaxID=2419772 RepID=A0A387ATV6_9LACO|nr:sugar transferase [Apilactobacillus bombintestini]AYF92176.1 sugar transferase [Apilactobacillus bombintestini]
MPLTLERMDDNSVNNDRFYLFVKRVFDIIISLFGLIITLPVTIPVIIAIKLEDGGPIFYTQTRVGKDGDHFAIFKFRSMITNADAKKKELQELNEIDGAMFKMSEDPRVTKVGKFIRKHSIDELPQLINVLIGDMALVGPRPPLTEEVAKYTNHDLKRLMVKPGCTGLWQVSGRNSLSFAEMVDLDLNYIEHASFLLDCKICIKTVWIMICPNDAY